MLNNQNFEKVTMDMLDGTGALQLEADMRAGFSKGMELIYVKPKDLIPSQHNCYSEEDIEELCDSIRQFSLGQPLAVRSGEDGKYTVIAGHRRRLAILKGYERGYKWFPEGIPCVLKDSEVQSTLDEQIMIHELNIHNRDNHGNYLQLISDLYYLYQAKKQEDDSFPESVMKRLADKLGIGVRQAQKKTYIATAADNWISDAVNEHKMSLDKASIISHLSQESQDELREYFEENGLIPSDVLDKYRKLKTQETDAKDKSEAEEKKQELPQQIPQQDAGASIMEEEDDELAGLSAINLNDFMESREEKYGVEEDDEDVPVTDDPQQVHGSQMLSEMQEDPMANARFGALSWFKKMSEKGIMTDLDQTFVDPMVQMLGRFYFPSIAKRGYIDAGMKETMKQIVDTLLPLLEE